jgi:hypothetical protein
MTDNREAAATLLTTLVTLTAIVATTLLRNVEIAGEPSGALDDDSDPASEAALRMAGAGC